ncbi:MAG: phosphoribosyltransferase [Pyrodictiaceae archaeon]
MIQQPHPKPRKFLSVSWRDVEEACLEIAEEIRERGIQVDVIIGILRGGWIPARILSDYLGVYRMGAVEVKFYRGIGETSEKPVITQPLVTPINDQHVLVVDDVADTGKTLGITISFLNHYGPRRIYSATLYVKPWAINRPDFYARETDAWIIFPWDKAETIEELVEKHGFTIEDAARVSGEHVKFVEKLFKTRNAGSRS